MNPDTQVLPQVLIVGLICAAGIPLIWWISTFNRVIRLRNTVKESWSNVDVALKRRHDLIPNLVATVKGYMAHEQEVLAQLVEARESAIHGESGVHARQATEATVAKALGTTLMRAEAYPELKASAAFLQLQEELVNTEDRIAAARRFYNANVREFNTIRESFPSSLVAGKYGEMEFFEVESLQVRLNPQVELGG